MSKEAIKLALDLATMHHSDDGYQELRQKVRRVAKAALAEQPVPVQGWKLVPVKPTREMVDALADTDPEHNSVWDAVLAAAPQPAQHPKAKAIAECLAVLRPAVKGKFPHEQALEELVGYIAAPQPAQHTWVGLTDEEIEKIWDSGVRAFFLLARAIEAKLKEKNT